MFKAETIQINPDWQPLLKAHRLDGVAAVYDRKDGEAVTRSGSTEVRRIQLGVGPETRAVFIKKYWISRNAQIWSGLFRGVLFGQSKARREFMNLGRLRKWGLDAPAAVAFGEERRAGCVVRSFLISEGVCDPMPLDRFIRDWLSAQSPAQQLASRGELIAKLAAYTKRMHDHHFVHHDYFWRNIILSSPTLKQFNLIDAHKGRVWPVWSEQRSRAKDLAALDSAAPNFFRRTERLEFLCAYLGRKKLTPQDKDFVRLVLEIATPMRERQLRRVLESRAVA